MAHSVKNCGSYSSKTALRLADFVPRTVADTWRRAGDVKAGWSDLERRQRALIGELKRNQIIELCFGKNALVNRRPIRQSIAEW